MGTGLPAFMAAAGVVVSSVAFAAPAVSCAPHAAAPAGAMQQIAPAAIRWAQSRSEEAVAQGAPLSPRLVEIARQVGVRHPDRVRIQVVDRIELPDEPTLKAAAAEVGLVPASAGGMTLGYGIVIVRGEESGLRLLSHELRHVAQYEEAGGIGPFLARHIPDLMRYGYRDSPYERDARAHEAR